MLKTITLSLALLSFSHATVAATKTIGVFVALADNEHQGIVPVPKAIGNGDDPERNLYWGTGEGLKGVFDHSKDWKLLEKTDEPQASVLRTRVYKNTQYDAVLTAKAYQGAAIKQGLQDFEAAIAHDSYDLVVFIGHNGLMDFQLPMVAENSDPAKRPAAIVLACKSAPYFNERIKSAGGEPILLTTQFMYPGSFILEAAAKSWLAAGNVDAIRLAAGKAYANNQKLSIKAGTGVFAKLPE